MEKNRTIEALMRQAQSGDAKAYMQVLEQVSAWLTRRLRSKVPAADLPDLVQEVLISLHKSRHTYDSGRPFLPFVAAIARYRLADHLRKSYANQEDAVDMADWEDVFAAEDVTERLHEREYVSKAVATLKPNQQKVITLMYREECSVEETAERLGMSVSAVKVTAHRAYKILRKAMS